MCQVIGERADAEGAHFSVRSERKDLEVLREHIALAKEKGVRIAKIISNPVDELVKYHLNSKK